MSSNKPRIKHVSENLSYYNYTGQDLSGHDFFECDLGSANFTNSNLSDSSLYRSYMVGTKLVGAKIALRCNTFRDVNFGPNNIHQLIYMLMISDLPDQYYQALLAIIGQAEKDRLDKIFRNKEI